MRVPQSTPDSLVRDGASIRVWHDSKAKLKALAKIRRAQMAVTFDLLVTEALQAEWDTIIEAGGTPPPLEARR